MIKLTKLFFLGLLVLVGYGVASNSTHSISSADRAIKVLEYMYANKLDKENVICQSKVYENDAYIKCFDKTASFWKLVESKTLSILAVEKQSATIVTALDGFKELSIDPKKVSDGSYKVALVKLFN